MGDRGPVTRIIYSKVHRVSLTEAERDLLPFFEAIDAMQPDRRRAALFAAIRGGQGAAQPELARTESGKAGKAIDALLDAFE